MVCAGNSLRVKNEKALTIKKQSYLVGRDKRLTISQYNSLRLFVETAYDDVHSDNPAYENKKQMVLETRTCLYL
ncbi:hypothetical protein EAE93_20765 [Photorhabdus akhurstii]|nr:hypothetical protein [Photorhabdus akhurstii]